jgi:nucleoside-diphosphate-sugar epimerase
MNILVTGATGFIGKNIVKELLDHKYKVYILTRQKLSDKNINIFQGDISKKETISKAFDGIDVVFHNAAYATDWGEKEKIKKINIEGTRNIAEICIKKNIFRLILTSSAGVYGFPNTNEIINEDSEIKPFNFYHKSKYESEKILKNYTKLNVSIIRPVLVLGACGKAANILLRRIEQKNMMIIGDGNQNISLVHPADVAQCLRLALEKDKNNSIFNAVSFCCPVKDLLNEIAKQMNVDPIQKHVSYNLAYFSSFFSEKFSRDDPSITRFRIKAFGTNRIVSNEKAKNSLGFIPKYNIQMIVKDMISGYKN